MRMSLYWSQNILIDFQPRRGEPRNEKAKENLWNPRQNHDTRITLFSSSWFVSCRDNKAIVINIHINGMFGAKKLLKKKNFSKHHAEDNKSLGVQYLPHMFGFPLYLQAFLTLRFIKVLRSGWKWEATIVVSLYELRLCSARVINVLLNALCLLACQHPSRPNQSESWWCIREG